MSRIKGRGYNNLSKSQFHIIRQNRYKIHPWLLKEFDTFDINGLQMLGIGYRMGTDHFQLTKRGGIMHSIDITPISKEITEQLFKLYNYSSELIIGDVENMPYEDNTFDFVYSFGVVHHTPDIQKTINKIYRILKPGGSCYIAVYNKNSWFFRYNIFLKNWILNKGYQKYTLKQQISLLEYPNNNKNLVVKLYTKKEVKKLFKKFSHHQITVNHLTKNELGVFNSIFTSKIKNYLRTKIGLVYNYKSIKAERSFIKENLIWM